ncbi:hypothetical protein N9F34_04605 [Alphaproteobacteria bacterium]|nr:hypothetical protein [Alphaproteobacteria bacterium]
MSGPVGILLQDISLDLLICLITYRHLLAVCHQVLVGDDVTCRWSMTTLRDRPIKIGGKIVRHGRYATLQMAEVAIP